jgi:hypothetical protein
VYSMAIVHGNSVPCWAVTKTIPSPTSTYWLSHAVDHESAVTDIGMGLRLQQRQVISTNSLISAKAYVQSIPAKTRIK